jgi:hypothetical protein
MFGLLRALFMAELWRGFTQKGSHVRFHLADVFLPNTADLYALFGEEEELEGTVVDFSDSGSKRGTFAVVQVEVIMKRTAIVLVEKLRLAEVDEIDRNQ